MQKIIYLLLIVSGAYAGAQTEPQAPLVTSGVSLSATQSTDDFALAARVREQIRAKVRDFAYQKYNIFSQSGQITIQGQAQSLVEAEEVLSAARTTPGIKSVVNAITVSPKF